MFVKKQNMCDNVAKVTLRQDKSEKILRSLELIQ